MEIQELKIFTSVIEEGGFKNAASVLGLTQPAVSQSIANLERKLNVQLVERVVPVQATQIGRELLKHAKFVLSSEEHFKDHLSLLKKGHLLNLKIATDHMMAKYYCPELIQTFSSKYPHAVLKIHQMPAREIIQSIHQKQFDIGIGPFQKNMQGLKKITLLKKESYLVTGKNNPHLSLYKKDPIEFLSKNILLASYLDSPDERPAKKKIRNYFKSAWEINNVSLQLELIKKGLGVTFIAKELLKADPLQKHIKILDQVPFSLIKKEYGVYFLKENLKSDAINFFLESNKLT